MPVIHSRSREGSRRLPCGRLLRHARTLLPTPVLLLLTLPAAWPAAAGVSATRLAQLPAAWMDDGGQRFDLHSLEGHAVVLTMAYATCHRVCPMTIKRLQQVQREYDRRGTRAEFVVIGYDPDNDDAAAWRQYRQSRHLTRSNWHFLIGAREAVEQTARQLGFEFWRYDQHVVHDSRILYFDERGALVATGETTELESIKR
jgi:protein SCO1